MGATTDRDKIALDEMALEALIELEQTPACRIYAARRGHFAAVRSAGGEAIGFRRVAGLVRLEVYKFHAWKRSATITRHALPAALEARAARLLDGLDGALTWGDVIGRPQ